MKYFVIALGIVIANFASASSIPTASRAGEIYDIFNHSDSLKSIIQEIRDGKLDPFYSYPWPYDLYYSGNPEATPGRSILAVYAVNRFSFDKRGDRKENMEMVQLLVEKGLDVQADLPRYVSTPYYIGPVSRVSKLIGLASISCDKELVNFLIQHGANPNANHNSWFQSAQSTRVSEPNSPEYMQCLDMTLMFLNLETELTEPLAKMILTNDSRLYEEGEALQEMFPTEISNILKSKFQFSFGIQPTSSKPDELWDRVYSDYFVEVYNYSYKTRDYWDHFSLQQKEWACYRSSFDEYVSFLKTKGWLDSDIKTKMKFDSFFVFIFAPYCASLSGLRED